MDGFSFTFLMVRNGTKIGLGYEGVRNCIKCYVSRHFEVIGLILKIVLNLFKNSITCVHKIIYIDTNILLITIVIAIFQYL